ncbi:unnamed protein product [Brachionus calyciflorus]|uniref:Uncharacterized protein n=1 Tax=Brachionus calyciflorus TaxID=104777 RepID=A0A814EHB1_9BILA|nr:unnamed protein product [Brachionus calyciflorus]
MSEEQLDLQKAISQSFKTYNSDLDFKKTVALSLFTAMTEQEERTNMEIATHESIISYLEKFEIETTEICTIEKLIECTNFEKNETLEGLDNEHRAMNLISEALQYLKEGKIHKQLDRISQALKCFENAGERLDTAGSLKRLNLILQTVHKVII